MLAIMDSPATRVRRLGASRPVALEEALGPRYEVTRGTTFFRQGDRLASVLLLEAGCAKTVRSFEDRDVIVSVRMSGWLLGAVSTLSGTPEHVLSAETLAACVLRPIAVERFRELARTDLTVCSWLLELIALESAHHLSLATLRGERAAMRLKRLLIDLAQLDGRPTLDGAVRIMVPVTQADMASMIGVRAAPLSRMLAELGTQGLIRRVGGRISIPKTSPLARYVSQPFAGAAAPGPGGGGQSELELMWVNISIDAGHWQRGPLQRSSSSEGGPAKACAQALPRDSPTTQRAFAAADRVTAFLRVYQGGGFLRPFQPITETVRITDAHDTVVYDDARRLTSRAFNAATRGADVTLPLPLARLAPGEHLLTVRADVEGTTQASVERKVRFSVTGTEPAAGPGG
jgi:CRP-like cAMP-binding protein